MLVMNKIIFIILFPSVIIAQHKLEVNLVYGIYINDHAERKFDTKERAWKLKGKFLEYWIDAHNIQYTNSINLTEREIKKISNFISKNKLIQTIDKELKGKYLNKYGYGERIKGTLNLNDEEALINIKTNSQKLIKEDIDGKRFYALEQLFYQIVENHSD